MPQTQINVPYHMRDDSDESDSQIESSSEAGRRGSASESVTSEEPLVSPGKDKKSGGKLKAFLSGGRKVKVGNVELHPDIDYADWSKSGPNLTSRAKMEADGMINIWVDLKKAVPDLPKDYARSVKEWATDPNGGADCPPLCIVIFIVGSRGDVQPYLSLALHLIESHAHRVRIATHPDFKDFVRDANKRLKGKTTRGVNLEGRLEFFDVGGDPKELMAYMVKNPGLLPAWETLKSGDIGKKRQMTQELLQGFYRSCIEADGVSGKSFAADAIISNPPAFAHVHIAEAMGLPLLMSFTMPWCATTEFQHPLVNVASSNAQKGLTNYFSYAMAEMLQWQGLGDVINHFRGATLGLEPLISRHGASVMERLKIPWTYCWSEGLIEKPDDWKEHIDISGFYFFAGDSDFEPDKDLAEFLAAGEPPIYVGFGSVVVEDSAAMTQTIFEGVKKAGVRALVSAGWGGLGGTDVPENVFILKGNIPHDWLFADGRVSAVCHHGGAGTTAIGLKNGLPTIVVPFFGDQKFWGDMIHRAGGGPAPIPQKTLSADNLSEAIKTALSPEAKAAAGRMGEKIRREDGEKRGVESFHKHLPLQNMRCDVDQERVAMWYSDQLYLRLSGEVAGALAAEGKLDLNKLRPLRAREYATRFKPRDPISGGSLAVMHLVHDHYSSVAQIFYDPPRGVMNTMFVIPQGLLDMVIAVFEGFDSLPRIMGSEMRERGQVSDFSSGVREGGKGLWYGWWDGITGLVTEPIAGGKKEGALGVIKGMGRSYVNVTARPAAGVLGVMALPIQGAWKSIRRSVGGAPEKALAKSRRDMTLSMAENVSPEYKAQILKRFGELEKDTEKRKENMKRKAKLFLLGDEKVMDESDSDVGGLSTEAYDKRINELQERNKKEGEAAAAAAKAESGKEGAKGSDTKDGGETSSVQVGSSQAGMEMVQEEVAQRVGAEAALRPEKNEEMEEAERRGYERAMREMGKQK